MSDYHEVLGYDLSAAMDYNGLGARCEDIAIVLLELTDGQDEPRWSWIVLLKDGTHAYVSGSHDYTGWDCQSSCDWHDAVTRRRRLGAFATG